MIAWTPLAYGLKEVTVKCSDQTIEHALNRIRAVEPEGCRKGKAGSWEFFRCGEWLNYGSAEGEVFEALVADCLPNKVMVRGWNAVVSVTRPGKGRSLVVSPTGFRWQTEGRSMLVGVSPRDVVTFTIFGWDGVSLAQGPVLAELIGTREHFDRLFIWSYAVALETDLKQKRYRYAGCYGPSGLQGDVAHLDRARERRRWRCGVYSEPLIVSESAG